MKHAAPDHGYSDLIRNLTALIEDGRRTAVRAVNTALVLTCWRMGQRIVEYEQEGKKRADYGEAILRRVSEELTKRFGRGFSLAQLKSMRRFYLLYSEKGYTLSSQLPENSIEHVSISHQKSKVTPGPNLRLSWSHYRLLISIDDSFQREFYEAESLRGNWSVRQLDRQIQSMLYERTALSKRKLAVIAHANEKPIALTPENEIKDPYVLEFLGLKDEYSETDLEAALIQHLERFLLEFGTGLTFVARQKRISLENSHFRLDLLFYHRGLRCLVAIELKTRKFAPGDAGQMNLYLNYLKDREMLPGENDPIGIILCSAREQTVVEYALGGLSSRVFAARYRLQLPDPATLSAEVERERKRLSEMLVTRKQS